MRMVQFGDESVLESKTICCAPRASRARLAAARPGHCGVMDALRAESRRQDKVAVKDATTFDDIFMANIKLSGRIYEPALLGLRNLPLAACCKTWTWACLCSKRTRSTCCLDSPAAAQGAEHVKPVEPAENRIAYYPGCSLHSTGAEFDHSTKACARNWAGVGRAGRLVCCGSSPAHHADPRPQRLSHQELSLIEKSGLRQVAAPCSSCYSRFKIASHQVATDAHLAQQVEEKIGYRYQNSVEVLHILDAIMDKIGPDKIAARTTHLSQACAWRVTMAASTAAARHHRRDHPEYP